MRALFDQLIVWMIVGLVGGSLAAIAVKRERKGFGVITNLGLGLAGAVVGGLVFRLFELFPQLDCNDSARTETKRAFLFVVLLPCGSAGDGSTGAHEMKKPHMGSWVRSISDTRTQSLGLDTGGITRRAAR